MRVLVIGGSGLVGRPTASELVRRGHTVAVLTRRGSGGPPGAESFTGDVTTGAGVAAALDGVECVVDCGNVVTMSRKAAVGYFTTTTRRLGELGKAAGVRHHVVLGIPDVAGPRPERLTDLARQLVAHRGERRTVVGLRLPGRTPHAMRDGGQLPGPDALLRGPTFRDWLLT